MATYTLSHTGAEVDAAVANALNIFSTSHTWMADQTFGNASVGSLTATVLNANGATINALRIGGSVSAELQVDAPSAFNDDVTVDGQVSATRISAEDGAIASDFSVGNLLEVGGDSQVDGTVYSNMVSSMSFRIPSRILVEFVSASVTAAHDGVYIAANASALTPFAAGATIPANVLAIYFL